MKTVSNNIFDKSNTDVDAPKGVYICVHLCSLFLSSVAKLTREEQKSCNLELVAK